MENKFTQATGRDLKLNGPIKLSLFPHLHLQIESLAIANLSGFRPSNFIEVDQVDVRVSLLSLFHGSLQFKQIVLTKPKLNLEQNGGLNNWSFKSAKNNSGDSNFNLTFHRVMLNEAEVNYINSNKLSKYHTTTLNILINEDCGEIQLSNRNINLKNVTLNINDIAKGLFNFKAKFKPQPEYQGQIKINKFVTKNLANKLGVNLPDILKLKGYSTVAFNSSIDGTDKYININELDLDLGRSNIIGDVSLGLNPYQLINNLKISKTEISDYVDISDFKLSFEFASLRGKLVSRSNNSKALNGQESVGINNLTLYGASIRKMNKQVTKALNDISGVESLVTYTQTLATVKKLTQEIGKLDGSQKKDYTNNSNLGDFNGNIAFKDGRMFINQCRLSSSEVVGLCSGDVNFKSESLSILIQGRVLPEGEKNVINYIYFPYYIRGPYKALDSGFDGGFVIEQITKYYNASQKDKPILNKLWDVTSGVFE